MGLVTIDVAKEHLKPPGTVDDVRIGRLIEEASAIVLDYIKLESDAYQDTDGNPIDDELPPAVRSACLLVLGALYDNADGTKDILSPAVKALLRSRRDPTLA